MEMWTRTVILSEILPILEDATSGFIFLVTVGVRWIIKLLDVQCLAKNSVQSPGTHTFLTNSHTFLHNFCMKLYTLF
jgi:hypothetical protein